MAELSAEKRAVEDAGMETLSVALVITLKNGKDEVVTRVLGRGDMDAMHGSFAQLAGVAGAVLNKNPKH